MSARTGQESRTRTLAELEARAAYVRAVVDRAPELTPGQADRLKAILGPVLNGRAKK